jgi:ubiquinone/menaquinone biosynthesis C-methylase UbiE
VEPWREAVWHAVPEDVQPERYAERRAFLLERVLPGERVLDLGCGDGTFTADLVAAGCVVAAVDVAEEAVRRARQRAPSAHVRRVAEGERLPFADDDFDVVWAGEVLEHVADVVGLLAEVRRVLDWGGRLLVTTPYHGRVALVALALHGMDRHFDPRADHLRFFTAGTLRAVLGGAGFRGIEVAAVGGPPLLRRALHATAR